MSAAEALPVHLHGSALARALLKLAGWQLRYAGLPARQGVLIVYPHTSNWDFPLAMFAKWALGLQVTFWGKDSLFKLPLFSAWLRWLGGVPVDRNAPNGIVGQMAQALSEARANDRFMWLALTPEGTRRYTPAWRSGFYHVALQSGVPVALVYLDYRQREIGVQDFLQLSGDVDADMARIAEVFGQRTGRNPAQASPIRLES